MNRFKLSLFVAALAAFASLTACGNNAPSDTAANTSNAGSNAAAKATPAPSPAATPDEFASARADFKQFCIRCHKENGTGGSVELEEGQKINVPNFHEGHALKHTEEQMIKTIENGDADEGMPAFKKRLDPERIAALARFIHHEFQSQPASGAGPAAQSPTPSH